MGWIFEITSKKKQNRFKKTHQNRKKKETIKGNQNQVGFLGFRFFFELEGFSGLKLLKGDSLG